MQRHQAIAILRQHTDDLRALGVCAAYLFGSVARDEALDSSDMDVLVEFDRTPTLFLMARVNRTLEDWLGVRVDLGVPAWLRPEFREQVMREAIRAA